MEPHSFAGGLPKGGKIACCFAFAAFTAMSMSWTLASVIPPVMMMIIVFTELCSIALFHVATYSRFSSTLSSRRVSFKSTH